MQVPIVDAAVQYECPYSGTLHVLIIRNALHVPSMKHNLVPPFMIREEGIQVNDTPKIQVNDLTTSDHSIYFPETNFRIPLSLWGVFSYFPSSKPMAQTLQETEEVYLLTPSRWNPHCDSYAQNEENMLDWEGNMVERKDRMQILIEDLPDGVKTIGSTQISCVESVRIDAIVEARAAEACEETDPPYRAVPAEADEVSAILSGVSPNLVDAKLLELLSARRDLGLFQATIGPTNAPRGTYLVETVNDNDSESCSVGNSDDESVTTLFESSLRGEINLDNIMVSAAHARRPKGIDAEHLSKTWRIDQKQAKRTLEITFQHSRRADDPTLSRNDGMNDRMLRYKRVSEYGHESLNMDTFVATKKSGKSSRGHTCCQLFVRNLKYSRLSSNLRRNWSP